MQLRKWTALMVAAVLGITGLTGTAFAQTAALATEETKEQEALAGEAAAKQDAEDIEENDAAEQDAEGAEEETRDTSYREEDYGYPNLLKFSATTLDEGLFTQDDLKDADLTILYVWSTTCGYCIQEMPELEELKESLPSNIQFITYCPDGVIMKDTVNKILEKQGLEATTLISGDDDFKLLDRQLMYTPTALFLDSEGYLACEVLIGAPQDPITVYNEIIDTALKNMGVERAEDPEDADAEDGADDEAAAAEDGTADEAAAEDSEKDEAADAAAEDEAA